MPYGINSGTAEQVREYLDYLARKDVKILYSLKDVYEGTPYYKKSQFGFEGEEAIVRGTVELFRNHPALLGWYLNDELPLSMHDRLRARYRLVRDLDPDHPTWSVLWQVGELAGYLDTADVLGTDPYPVPHQPVTMAADWTRRTAAASGGARAVWQVPQAFDWACYKKEDPAKYRAPTLEEMRVMTLLCLIHGARGLVYYSYFDLQKDRLGFDRRWADMEIVGREVEQLFPALLSAASVPQLDVRPDSDAVHTAQLADDAGNRYVLMANPDPGRPARVTVAVPRGTRAEVLERAVWRSLDAGKDPALREVTLPPMGAASLVIRAQ